jgi:Ras-related protein Rab-5C
MQGNPNMIMALAGNKADLAEARAVTKEEAQIYADENSLTFWETSAKANMNVTDVFQDIAERLPKAASASPQQPQNNIQLNAQPDRPKKAGCCG